MKMLLRIRKSIAYTSFALHQTPHYDEILVRFLRNLLHYDKEGLLPAEIFTLFLYSVRCTVLSKLTLLALNSVQYFQNRPLKV